MKILIRLVLLGAAVGGLLPGSAPLCVAAQTHGVTSARGGASSASNGHFTPGYLGVYLRATSGQAAAGANRKQAVGVEVMSVDRDAPAGRVGLRPHDIIAKINGRSITSGLELRSLLRTLPAGRTIHLEVIRDGQTRNIAVKLASRAEVAAASWSDGVIFADGFPVATAVQGFANKPFGHNLGPDVKLREFAMLGCDGLEVEPIGEQLAAYFGMHSGRDPAGGLLVRNVEAHSVSAADGLEAGDVILAVNGMPSTTLRGWLMVVSQNQGKTVRLTVMRNHRQKLIEYTPGGHS